MFDEQPNVDTEIFIVSQECIDTGRARNPSHCMSALAIKEAGGEDVVVNKEGVVSFSRNGRRIVGWCSALMDKIHVFDHGGKVEPFHFNLESVEVFDLNRYKSLEDVCSYQTHLTDKKYPLWKNKFGL